jgi:hypothetical protein
MTTMIPLAVWWGGAASGKGADDNEKSDGFFGHDTQASRRRRAIRTTDAFILLHD